MKNISAQSKLYFSAYPLKAITSPLPDGATENSALHITNKKKTGSRLLVFPMINPYKEDVNSVSASIPDSIQEDSEEIGKGWYGNYE